MHLTGSGCDEPNPQRRRVRHAVLFTAVVIAALLLALSSQRASSACYPVIHLRRLEALDFDVGLSELKKYKAKNGDLVVPQSAVVEVNGKEMKIGRW